MIYKSKFFFMFIMCLLLIRVEGFAKQNVSESQISDAIEKVKTSASDFDEQLEAMQLLYDLTRKINKKNISDKTLNDIVNLLDIPEARSWVSSSLANLKSRAKRAVPRMIEVLKEEVCNRKHVDLIIIRKKFDSADYDIRSSLKEMRVKDPVIDCSVDYSAPDISDIELKNLAAKLMEIQTGNQTQSGSSNIKRNGTIYNPDGIDLIYVEGVNDGAMNIKSFYIGRYEITQEQWSVLMGKPPRKIEGNNLPVDYVNWDDVQEFLVRLSVATGRNYRLPTAMEWEYAVRGGSAEPFCLNGCEYSGSNDMNDVAWFYDGRPHPVGTKQPNELGIYDMNGNVWEWVSDLYVYSPQTKSKSSKEETFRMVYGCGWGSSFGMTCPINAQSFDNTGERFSALGFRVVLDVD